MTSVLHLLDASCDETQFQVLATLQARHTSDGLACRTGSVDPQIVSRARRHLVGEIAVAHRRRWMLMSDAPTLPRIAQAAGANLVHAWGLDAAIAAGTRLRHLPLLVTLLRPESARELANWLRSMPGHATVAAGSQVIRSRLMAAGIPAERIVVIRGPADFSAVNKARQVDIRREVVGDARPVVLMDGPPSRGGGQYFGIWAAAVLSRIFAGLRVLMPYESSESRRLQRFVRQIRMSEWLVIPDPSLTWPQLVTCADVFCCPAIDEICTEPLASAMAAGIPVVGSAVRSIAEIIADRHNGLLCKPQEPRALASKLLMGIEDMDTIRRVTEVARGQAYEVFGVRAFADNYARLYENLIARRSAAEGVSDTAMVA